MIFVPASSSRQSPAPGSLFTWLSMGLGIVVALGLAFLAWKGAPPFSTVDNLFQDALIRHLPREISSSNRTLVVDLDEDSLVSVGQWPWPRYRVAALVKALAENKAKVIGLDILFSEPDRTSLKTIRESFLREFELDIGFTGLPPGMEDNDAYLGHVLSKTGAVSSLYMYFTLYNTEDECAPPCLSVEGELDAVSPPEATGILCNTRSIQEKVTSCGFINTSLDSDGVLRKMQLLIAYKDRLYPNLTLATLMQALGESTVRVETDAFGPVLVVGPARLPVDRSGQAVIGFNGREYGPDFLSAVRVLSEEADTGDIQDKIVFIGSSAAGLNDLYHTPISQAYPGVATHAVLAENALSGGALRVPVWAALYAALATFGAGLIVIVLFCSAGPGHAAFWSLVLGLAFPALATVLYYTAGALMPVAGPLLTSIVLFTGMSLLLYSRERRKALNRLQMFAKARQTTLEAMAAVAETRDPETGGHIKRTQLYIKVLAEYLSRKGAHPELTAEYIEMLFHSAPLHDIGKVGVPDAILMKPGKLTDAEFVEMKKHTDYGLEIIRNAGKDQDQKDFFNLAEQIVYTHHEKWDGSGYPQGLAGSDIPLSGRLMALVDVYDALVSLRHYKPPYSHEYSRDTIVQGRGTHFDPDIVDAFLATEQEFIRIATALRDDGNKDPDKTAYLA